MKSAMWRILIAIVLWSCGYTTITQESDDAREYPQVIQNPECRGLDVEWSPDGTRLLSGICIFDAETGVLLLQLGKVYATTWNPDGTLIAGYSARYQATIWDANSGEIVEQQRGPDEIDNISGMVFLANVHWLPEALYVSAGQTSFWLWEFDHPERATGFPGHRDIVVDAKISPDGQYVASSGLDRMIHIWDLESGARLVTVAGHRAFAWGPDSNRIAFAHYTHLVAATINSGIDGWVSDFTGGVMTLDWSQDGSKIAGGFTDGRIIVWAAADGAVLAEFQVDERTVESVHWHPDNQHLASVNMDGIIRIWWVE